MKTIIGIDFGTTNMRVAALVDGRPVIIENKEGDGTTPSVVCIRSGRPNLVGKPALREASRYPERVVSVAKRLIGRRFDDIQVQMIKSFVPYEIVRGTNSSACIKIDGTRFDVVNICSMMFEYIKKFSSEGLSEDINQAVVAVPAYYGEEGRRIVKLAASKAGIDILRIVSEPTSAALFYGLAHRDSAVLAFYDLGGGTFDFSIIEIGDGVFEVLATGGDTMLGGEDFDLRLQRHVMDCHGLHIDELTSESKVALKSAVEDAKIALSGSDEVDICISSLSKKDGTSIDVLYNVTSNFLQDLCQDLIDRTLEICQETIDEVRINSEIRSEFIINDIDEVVLIGGSTRLPFIEQCVSRMFSKSTKVIHRREDAVALGCAVQAGVLSGSVKDVLLLDVLPHALGVRWRKCSMIILDRHKTIPCKQVSRWSDSSRTSVNLEIEVFEGDSFKYDQISIIKTLKVLHVKPVGGWIQVEVSIDADVNGNVTVIARDLNGDGISTEAIDETKIEKKSVKVAPIRSTLLERDLIGVNKGVQKNFDIINKGEKVLCIATEWRSKAGGLSTFNRLLCQALAKAGKDVCCMVIDPDPYEISLAEKSRVQLIPVKRRAGVSDQSILLRKPVLPKGWVPEIIIGHSRITGLAAEALANDHFPTARRVHIVHMAPDEIEWFKGDRSDDAGGRAAERTNIERDLASSAAYAAAVGPRLHGRFLNELSPSKVEVIRIDPGFDNDDMPPLAPPPGHPYKVLVAGRMEDFALKGLDIAALALKELSAKYGGDKRYELLVRGAPQGQAEELRKKLIEFAGSAEKIVVRPYDSSPESLDGDYRRASVVLMPSRSEGFGLVGLEAIVAGVPVLISSESGLAELLRESLPAESYNRLVVPVTNDLEIDQVRWAAALWAVMTDRESSFLRASILRQHLSREYTWNKTVASLMKKISRGEQGL